MLVETFLSVSVGRFSCFFLASFPAAINPTLLLFTLISFDDEDDDDDNDDSRGYTNGSVPTLRR